MKTPSILNSMQALRGLRNLALAALASSLLTAGVQASVVNLLSNSGFTDGADGLDGWSTTLNPPGTSTCCSSYNYFVVTGAGSVNGPFDGSGPFNIDFNHAINLVGNAYSTATLAFAWNPDASIFGSGARVFSVQLVDASNNIAATLYTDSVSGYDYNTRNVSVDVAATLNTLPAGAYTFRFDSFIPENYSGPADMTISGLSLTAELKAYAVFAKGNAVPGVTGKTFTSFGVPTINDSADIAFLGKWSGGSGIFLNGQLLAKVGQATNLGLNIKSLKDPVIDNLGDVNTTVVFPAALTTDSAHDSAVLELNLYAGLTLGTPPTVIAQEGVAVGGGLDSAIVWKSFTSVAATSSGRVLILGTLPVGVGGITSANATILYLQNPGTVLLQGGSTVIGAKTVKSFVVLKGVTGSPGQTHAFNGHDEVVAKVTFSDGAQAVVHIPLPPPAS